MKNVLPTIAILLSSTYTFASMKAQQTPIVLDGCFDPNYVEHGLPNMTTADSYKETADLVKRCAKKNNDYEAYTIDFVLSPKCSMTDSEGSHLAYIAVCTPSY